jgi:Tfp pilus assembly protein PilV
MHMTTTFERRAPRGSAGRRRRGQRGISLVEVITACTVIVVGALAALGTLVSSVTLETELAQRAVALRAASTKMETILAYDYGDSISNLKTHWELQANQTFSIDGLPTNVTDKTGATAPQGSITLDVTDPERTSIVVTVTWTARNGQRTLTLPTILTEVVP